LPENFLLFEVLTTLAQCSTQKKKTPPLPSAISRVLLKDY